MFIMPLPIMAWLDVEAQGFWGPNRQHVFFDIKIHLQVVICDCLCPSVMLPMSKRRGVLWWEGKGGWEDDFLHWCFLLVVVWAHLLPQCKKQLASMLADRWVMNYCWCLFWLRCRVAFRCWGLLSCVWGDIILLCIIQLYLAYSEGRLKVA